MVEDITVSACVHLLFTTESSFSLQVSLKIEEKEVEHVLKGKAFLGNILAAGLP